MNVWWISPFLSPHSCPSPLHYHTFHFPLPSSSLPHTSSHTPLHPPLPLTHTSLPLPHPLLHLFVAWHGHELVGFILKHGHWETFLQALQHGMHCMHSSSSMLHIVVVLLTVWWVRHLRAFLTLCLYLPTLRHLPHCCWQFRLILCVHLPATCAAPLLLLHFSLTFAFFAFFACHICLMAVA